jgi:hypothetical protein
MAQKINAAANHGVDVFIFDWYYYNDGPFLQDTVNRGYLRAPNHDGVKFAQRHIGTFAPKGFSALVIRPVS